MTDTQKVSDVMTRDPKTLPASATVRDAAREMERSGLGAVMVDSNGELSGLVTDRDIVVRCLARNGNCDEMPLHAICSSFLATLSPNDTVKNAIALMSKKAIRRIPVVEGGRAIGILSIGDLAQNRDPYSALGGISAAAPNT